MTAQDIERFLSKIRILSDDDCWLWIGGTIPGRRGRRVGAFTRQGKTALAHRAAYELHYGMAPGSKSVLHHCDVPLCCNPGHLFLGTQADNMADMVSKGRSLHRYADASPHRKLTSEMVSEIRSLWMGGGLSQSEIGLHYGIAQAHVSAIILGKSWPVKP